jgi:acetaldehyde dehydrogenase / alcohol dehydrogenase
MARVLALGASCDALFERVDALLDELGMPRTAQAAGIDAGAYRAAVPELSMTAFADLSLRTNPRMPLVAELRDLLDAV